MTEKKNEEIAVFRFGVIQEFVGGAMLTPDEKRKLIREKCERKWVMPYSNRTRISESTIYRWIRRYSASGGGIESLYPQNRNDKGKTRRLDSETVAVIINERKQKPNLPVPLFVEGLKRRNIIPKKTGVATIYRLLHENDLMSNAPKPEDRRKFEAELPNDIWQSDVMHGPKVMVNGKNRKTYLIAFLDDHSRMIVFGGFYLNENLVSFMDAFEKALAKRGLPRKLYVDNGPAFRSHHLEFTCASLSISLIHARPYKPQGKGKVERFFRTVRSRFLHDADTASLESLNASFLSWLEIDYNQRKHSATGMRPFERFTRNLSCIRKAPDNLCDHFRITVTRRVAKDRTVTLNGNLFEAPVILIGKRVLLLYHAHEPKRIEVFFNHESYGFLVPVNLNVNCRIKRDKNSNAQLVGKKEENEQDAPVKTSYRGGGLWK